MIPIRDTIQSKNYPIVNNLIIGVNIFVYLIQMSQGSDQNIFIFTYGLVPAKFSSPEIAAYFSPLQQFISLFSFMFLHGGFWHLLGNMWSLYIFGDNVEDRMGPFRYLAFYILCGVASGASHMFLNWHSQIPTIGASGAIAGVMGAYFLLYPKSRILTLIPIFFIPYFIEIPAFFFLGIWFLIQFISAAGAAGQGGGIAWWAHIGGFIFGMIFLRLLDRIPSTGITGEVRKKTAKKKTHHLQTARVMGRAGDSNLYGSVTITAREERLGSRKLINIPWGFKKRLFRITIPPAVKDGAVLRLAGMGKDTGDGGRGDLLLKIKVED